MIQQLERHGAGVRRVHLLRWFDGRPACGASPEHVVGTYAKVTCRACKRSRAWQDRGQCVPGERRA